MVDALRQIHQSLTTDGALLDVHPEPVNSRIEVWQGEEVHVLGELDQEEDIREIEVARSRLNLLVDEGLFSSEASDNFELRHHYESVESWQEKWAEDDYRLVANQELFDSARLLLATGGGDLVVREEVRALRLRRLQG